MALARITTWTAGDVLTASALNAEFNNIINNALSLISPLTSDLAFGGNRLTGLSKGSEASPGWQWTGDADTGMRSSGADILEMVTGGNDRWQVNASGHLLAVDDATYDIGASAATRPRHLYMSGTATIGTGLTVSGTGPHAIGGATDSTQQLLLLGTFAPTSHGSAFRVNTTLTVPVAANAHGVHLGPTLNKAASGTHALFTTLNLVAPVIGAGAATGPTQATTLYINAAPTGGTANFAILVDAGLVSLNSTTEALRLTTSGDVTGVGTIYQRFNDANGNCAYLGYGGSAASAFEIFNGKNGPLIFSTNNAEVFRMTAVKNMKIAGTAVRATTEGTNHLDIFDGTAPVGTLANGISLYSTAGELRAMDAAGNATLLSPHDKRTNEWIYDSVDIHGKHLRVDMERLVKAVNARLGMDFVHEYTVN